MSETIVRLRIHLKDLETLELTCNARSARVFLECIATTVQCDGTFVHLESYLERFEMCEAAHPIEQLLLAYNRLHSLGILSAGSYSSEEIIARRDMFKQIKCVKFRF